MSRHFMIRSAVIGLAIGLWGVASSPIILGCKKNSEFKNFSELSRPEKCERLAGAMTMIVSEETQRYGKEVVEKAFQSDCENWPESMFDCNPYGAEVPAHCVRTTLDIADTVLRKLRALAPPGPPVHWNASLKETLQLAPERDDDFRYELSETGAVFGYVGDTVFGIHKDATQWKRTIDGFQGWLLPVVGAVLIADKTQVHALDPRTGANLWSVKAKADVGAIDIDGRLLIGDRDGKFAHIDHVGCLATPSDCTLTKAGGVTTIDAKHPVLQRGAFDWAELVVDSSGRRYLRALRDGLQSIEVFGPGYDRLFTFAAQDYLSESFSVADDKHLSVGADDVALVLNIEGCKSPGAFALRKGDGRFSEYCTKCALAPPGCIVSEYSNEEFSAIHPLAAIANGGTVVAVQNSLVASRANKVLWKSEVFSIALWADQHHIYAVCHDDDWMGETKILRMLSPETGKPLWESVVPIGSHGAPRITSRENWILVSNQEQIAVVKLADEPATEVIDKAK